jgi:hypothetical protein
MDDYISIETFTTVAGAAGIVIVVFNSIRTVFGWGTKWFGLLLSILLAFIGVMLTKDSSSSEEEISMSAEIIITVLNGFVIFASAFSIQNIILQNANKQKEGDLQTQSSGRKYNWTSPW